MVGWVGSSLKPLWPPACPCGAGAIIAAWPQADRVTGDVLGQNKLKNILLAKILNFGSPSQTTQAG